MRLSLITLTSLYSLLHFIMSLGLGEDSFNKRICALMLLIRFWLLARPTTLKHLRSVC